MSENAIRIFFCIKGQTKIASDDIIENTLSPPEISNTLTEAEVTDLFDLNIIEITNTPLQTKYNFFDLTAAQE